MDNPRMVTGWSSGEQRDECWIRHMELSSSSWGYPKMMDGLFHGKSDDLGLPPWLWKPLNIHHVEMIKSAEFPSIYRRSGSRHFSGRLGPRFGALFHQDFTKNQPTSAFQIAKAWKSFGHMKIVCKNVCSIPRESQAARSCVPGFNASLSWLCPLFFAW